MKPYYYKIEKEKVGEIVVSYCIEDCLVGKCQIGSVACSECPELVERDDKKNSVTCKHLQKLANEQPIKKETK
jgi:hypothetical protein